MDNKEELTYKIEITKLYYDEFKYRHTHFWQIYFKYMYAMLFLFALYFVGEEYIKDIQLNVHVILALITIAILMVDIVGTIALKEEYYRIRCVSTKYNNLLLKEYKHQSLAELENRNDKKDKKDKNNKDKRNLVKELGGWQVVIFILLGVLLSGMLIYLNISLYITTQ